MLSTLALLVAPASALPPQDTLVLDVQPGGEFSDGLIGYSGPIGERLLFNGNDGTGRELWVSDGTPEGTEQLYDFKLSGSGGDPRGFTSLGDVVLFSASDDQGSALWRSDGTTGGTIKLGAPWAQSWLTRLGDRVIVYAEPGGQGELWRSDGTAEGTELFANVPKFGYKPPGEAVFVQHAGDVYFITDSNQLWKSDGTQAGTVMLKQFTNADDPVLHAAGPSGVFFAARDDAHGRELWHTDGTIAGTDLLKDLVPGAGSSNIRRMATLDDGTVLIGDSPDFFSGQLPSLWRSDGTEAGTEVVVPAYTWDIVSAGSTAVYMTGEEVWRTDGTALGTVFLGQAQYQSFNLREPRRLGGGEHVLFTARGWFGSTGWELWVADGDGIELLADVNPLWNNSYPGDFQRAGDRLFFFANDGTTGSELHALPLDAVGGAWVAEPFGAGCGVSGSPDLSFAGEALLGGAGELKVSGASPLAPAVLAFSVDRELLDLGAACTGYLAFPVVEAASFATDALGEATLAFPLPAEPALVGETSFFQVAALVPGGPLLGVAELSNAVELILGDPAP